VEFVVPWTEITPPAPEGHRAPKVACHLVRILPAEDRGDGAHLWETIKRLAPLTPNFVSVTYGAGGSTRERTHSTIARILTETGLLRPRI